MKIKVVLQLSKRSNAKILVDAEHYINCMTNNSYFTSPYTIELIAACKIRREWLMEAINSPVLVSKKNKEQIARDALDRYLTKLGANVEEVANDPSIPDVERELVVRSAGMKIKKQGRPGKHVFSAKNTNISGKVLLTAEGCANSHEWQYTEDIQTFTGRVSLKSTTVANTEIENLSRGTEYAFFHHSVKARKDTDWEGPIFLMVL